jgi:mRNA-degrading endonuclease RelE of RelBE toxin-antitoxin system
MKTVPLNQLFDVEYGNKFDLNKMQLLSKSEGGINFVNRSARNCGVSATVAPHESTLPYEAGNITVSLGGSFLSSFVQLEKFYTGQNVAVLTAKEKMSFAEKLYVCLCIRHNRFRYSAFGREANRTLRTLPIPARSEFPAWLKDRDVSDGEYPVYRVRQGDYRILYSVRPIIIVILDIGHRKDVYR